MNLDAYLVDGESVEVQAEAYDDKNAVGSESRGTLACTRDRLVYVNGKDVIDVSLRSVNAIQYRSPSFPTRYMIWGAIGLVGALLAWTVFPEFVDEEPIRFALTFGGVFGGVVSLFVGLLLMRRHELEVHTPAQSFDFSSSDAELGQIAHAVRGHEP